MTLRSSVYTFTFLSVCFCASQKSRDPQEKATIKESAKAFKIDKNILNEEFSTFLKSAHPFGSERQKEIHDFMQKKLLNIGLSPRSQPFTARVPKRNAKAGDVVLDLEKSGQNLVAKLNLKSQPKCYTLLGSHYDTKVVPGIEYVGANDSGSSSLLVLHMSRFLVSMKNKFKGINCDIVSIWFDGEESVLDGWNDGLFHPAGIHDNTYGSRHFVSQLKPCGKNLCFDSIPVNALILLDLVGDKNFKITEDKNSSKILKEYLKEASEVLGYQEVLFPNTAHIEDDHIPFVNAEIPSLNIIDFYNLGTWHNKNDTLENVSFDSMEKAGQIATYVLLAASYNLLRSS